MKPIISLERRDAILALANKRTQVICTLMENNHIGGYDEVLRLVDRPVGTDEEIRNLSEDQHIERVNAWYDLIANACRYLQDIGLNMTDCTSAHWYDEQVGEMLCEYANELLSGDNCTDCPYKGQRLYCSPIDYYGLEVCDKLKTALLDCESEDAKRLLGLIKTAVEKYI